jgi:hypothetical protein
LHLQVDVTIEPLRHWFEIVVKVMEHLLFPRRIDGKVTIENDGAFAGSMESCRCCHRDATSIGDLSDTKESRKFEQCSSVHLSSPLFDD